MLFFILIVLKSSFNTGNLVFFVIKIINKTFISLRNSFYMYFYWINMPSMTPKKIFLIIIFVD